MRFDLYMLYADRTIRNLSFSQLEAKLLTLGEETVSVTTRGNRTGFGGHADNVLKLVRSYMVRLAGKGVEDE